MWTAYPSGRARGTCAPAHAAPRLCPVRTGQKSPPNYTASGRGRRWRAAARTPTVQNITFCTIAAANEQNGIFCIIRGSEKYVFR